MHEQHDSAFWMTFIPSLSIARLVLAIGVAAEFAQPDRTGEAYS